MQPTDNDDAVSTAQEWAGDTIADFHARQIADGLVIVLPLPSGRKVKVTRPPLATWFAYGQMPSALAELALSALGKTNDMAEVRKRVEQKLKSDPAALRDSTRFAKQIVQYAVVEPRVVDEARLGENELTVGQIPSADLDFLMQWVMGGCAGVPVKTDGGAMSDVTLSNFRADARGLSTAGSGPSSQDVRSPA